MRRKYLSPQCVTEIRKYLMPQSVTERRISGRWDEEKVRKKEKSIKMDVYKNHSWFWKEW